MRYISAILLALVAVITADIPLPLDVEEVQTTNTESPDTAHRLPEDLDPIHYDIEITPYFQAEGTHEAFTFDGVVKITFKVLTAGLNSFVIHERVRSIKEVTLATVLGVNVPLHTTKYEQLADYQFLRVNLPVGQILDNGADYILTVEYVGNINETPLLRGVFRGSYKDANGIERWYLATHLQPTNSRQAFPSFDEPGFKSTFRIIINRPPGFSPSFSNMDVASTSTVAGRVREVFHVTPRMSAYLVTFHVHDGFTVINDNNNPQRSYRILARPNAAGQGDYAQAVGPPLTDWLSEYFGIDYYNEMEPRMKNDQIASPYWASGATENWGLVTYRELRLLYEEGETNAVDKLAIGTITAHELAHKWFGNLITCRWWDNVWINEGFASYFEYFAMDAVDKDLELADQFNIMYVQSALSADSAAVTRALQHDVNTPAQVTSHFSGISYSKGASLLLMLRTLLGEKTFKDALHDFLKEKSNQHAFPADLYSSFSKAVTANAVTYENFEVISFMKYWVEEQGYPVLKVTVNPQTGRIDLEQNRFFVSGAPPTEQAWPIPLTFTTATNSNWENLLPAKVMTAKTDFIQTAAGTGWVIFNVQQKSIYRVNYDENNWRLIAEALNTNFNAIHRLNRAQIVDDVFALMRASQLSYDLGFRVLEFLKKDTSYYSWYPAISGFTWLRNRFLHLPEQLAAFDTILYGYLEAVIADLGYDVVANEPLTRTLNRFYVLSFACNIGHQGCVNNAVAKFQNYFLNSQTVSINPNLRRHVFCEGLRAGGLPEWTFLNTRRQNSNNQADEAAMLRALGCTTNVVARQQYLDNILHDDVVKAQDRVNAFNWFYMGHRSNARFALTFLKERITDIKKAVYLPTWFNSVISNIAGYLDSEGLEEMRSWIQANQADIPALSGGITAISSAETSRNWGTNNADLIITAANGAQETTDPPITVPPITDPPITDPPITDPPITDPPITDPPITDPPITDPPITDPPITDPPITDPPITDPPITDPPITDPPITDPPITDPPITDPPITDPPITDPPITDPPITDPPITDPPITDPPITDPPITDPPTEPDTEQDTTIDPLTEPDTTTDLPTEPDTTTDPPTEPDTTTDPPTEATTPDPNSAAIYMPTTMLLLWTALAMLLK